MAKKKKGKKLKKKSVAKPKRPVSPSFTLEVGDPNLVSPNMPVRWCLNNELCALLKNKGVTEAHLLIAITRGERLLHQELVKLGKGMTTLEFHYAGDHTVHAMVVWVEEQRHKSRTKTSAGRWRVLYNMFLRDGRGDVEIHDGVQFRPDLVQQAKLEERNSRGNHELVYCSSIDHCAKLTVNVAESLFAPDPAPWRIWYANLWHSSSSDWNDQCHFRRRFWVYGLLKLPFVLAYMLIAPVIRLVLAVLAIFLLAWRDILWEAIWRVFRWKTLQVVNESTYTFTNDLAGHFNYADKNGKRRPTFLIFALFPLTWVVLAALMYGVHAAIQHWDTALVQIPLTVFGIIAAAIAVAVMSVRTELFQKLEEAATDKADEITLWLSDRSERKERERLNRYFDQQLGGLTCPSPEATTDERRPVTVSSLPSTHRTIRLYARAGKTRLCKQFKRK